MRPLVHMRALRDDPAASHTMKAVGWAIALRANHQSSICTVGYARLALDTGLSRRAVIAAVSALCDSGWLLRVQRYDKGRQTTNVYRLTGGAAAVESTPPDAVDNPPRGVHHMHPGGAHGAPSGGAPHAPQEGVEVMKCLDNDLNAVDNSTMMTAVIGNLARSTRM